MERSLFSGTIATRNKKPRHKIINMQEGNKQNFSPFWWTLEGAEMHITILDGETQICIKL